MPKPKSLSIYLEADHVADTWFWEYSKDEDEWRFFADDYEPVNSVKVVRWNDSIIPVFLRGTTMPKGVREAVMRSGLTLFKKSDAGISHVALGRAAIMRMADELLAVEAEICAEEA